MAGPDDPDDHAYDAADGTVALPPSPSEAPPAPPAGATGSTRHWPRHFIGVSTVLAWVSVLCFVAGAVLILLPVRNQIQRCGVPAAFLATGRQTVHAAAAPPGHHGFTKSEANAINRNLCSALVADRAVPGAALLASTLVLGIVGFLLAALGHRAEWRDFANATGKHLPGWKETAGAPPPPPPPPPPPV